MHLDVDFTRPVDICAFPVTAHSEGRLTGKEYRDENGVLVHEVDNVQRNYTISYTNPANGRSISTSLGGTVTYDFRPDGSYTYVIAGLERMFIAHGQGPIAKQVGRIEVDVAADGTQTTVFQAGSLGPGPQRADLHLSRLTQHRGSGRPEPSWPSIG